MLDERLGFVDVHEILLVRLAQLVDGLCELAQRTVRLVKLEKESAAIGAEASLVSCVLDRVAVKPEGVGEPPLAVRLPGLHPRRRVGDLSLDYVLHLIRREISISTRILVGDVADEAVKEPDVELSVQERIDGEGVVVERVDAFDLVGLQRPAISHLILLKSISVRQQQGATTRVVSIC